MRNEANCRPRRDGRGIVCRVCHRDYMRRYRRYVALSRDSRDSQAAA
jgi:hypothetical protein